MLFTEKHILSPSADREAQGVYCHLNAEPVLPGRQATPAPSALGCGPSGCTGMREIHRYPKPGRSGCLTSTSGPGLQASGTCGCLGRAVGEAHSGVQSQAFGGPHCPAQPFSSDIKEQQDGVCSWSGSLEMTGAGESELGGPFR